MKALLSPRLARVIVEGVMNAGSTTSDSELEGRMGSSTTEVGYLILQEAAQKVVCSEVQD